MVGHRRHRGALAQSWETRRTHKRTPCAARIASLRYGRMTTCKEEPGLPHRILFPLRLLRTYGLGGGVGGLATARVDWRFGWSGFCRPPTAAKSFLFLARLRRTSCRTRQRDKRRGRRAEQGSYDRHQHQIETCGTYVRVPACHRGCGAGCDPPTRRRQVPSWCPCPHRCPCHASATTCAQDDDGTYVPGRADHGCARSDYGVVGGPRRCA